MNRNLSLTTACEELTENLDAHILLREMTKNITRKMVLKEGYVVDGHKDEITFLEDIGAIESFEAWDYGTQDIFISYRLLKVCNCINPGQEFFTSGFARTARVENQRERMVRNETNDSSSNDKRNASGVKSRSAQKLTRTWLAKEYFPHLLMSAKIPLTGHNTNALVGQIGNLLKDPEIELEDVKWLMEFSVSAFPQYYKETNFPAWKVFISKAREFRNYLDKKRQQEETEQYRRAALSKPRTESPLDKALREKYENKKEETEEDDDWERHIYGLGL